MGKIRVIIVYMSLAIAYAILVPSWDTPDEPAHYRYVADLARRKRPPENPKIIRKGRFCEDYNFISSNYEWYHPAIGYLPISGLYALIAWLAPNRLPAEIPPLNPLFCASPFEHLNMFVHPALGLINTWKNMWGFLILRWGAALMGILVIWAALETACLLDMKESSFLPGSLISLLPQFIFISSSIRNDTTTNALAALLFLFSARLQYIAEPQAARRQIFILGITAGLGLLSKLAFLYVFPVAILAVWILPVPSSEERIRNTIRLTLPSLMFVGLYYGLYPEARAALHHTALELRIHPRALTWDYWRPVPAMLIELFFARFGWANVALPQGWIPTALGLWAIGAALTLGQALTLRRKPESAPLRRVLILLALGEVLAWIGVLRYNLSQFQPQGRFLFPALVPWAILGTWGLSRLPRTHRRILSITWIAYMGLLNAISLLTLTAAYH
jgi:hypothetical protein